MENSRLRKTYLNSIWLIINQVVAFIVSLILPRLIISTYGSAYNGMISSITQFLGFISILRLGVAGASRVSLYKSLAEGDIKKTSGIVKATEKYMQKIGYTIIVYVAVLSIVYPYILRGNYSYAEVAVLVVAIGIGTFAQYFFGITYQTLLAADQRLYVYNAVQTATVVANCALSAVLIIAGLSIQMVKLCASVIYLVNPIFLNYYVSRKYKIDKKCEPDNSALQQRGDVMGHSIANIVHENTDMIVLTIFCNVSIVSVYSVYNLVMGGIKQLLNIFTYSSEAVLGNMWAKGEKDSIRKNLSYFEYMVSSFISIVFPCTILLILPFVSLYVKGINDVEYVLPVYALIIIIAQIFFCFRTPYLSLVQAAGRYKETKHGAYLEAAINLILSVILVQFVGIVGTAVGTLAANIFRTAQYSFYVSKHLVKRSNLVVVKRLLWILLNIIVVVLVCYPFTSRVASLSWSKWVGCGIASMVISVICCVVSSYFFFRSDFNGLVSIGKRMLRRKK